MLTVILVKFIVLLLVVKCQKVNVTVFTESQCKFCTRLLHDELWPIYQSNAENLNIQIVPFGFGRCDVSAESIINCYCMHGSTECDINRLQNCAIKYFPHSFFPLLVCAQGKQTLQQAINDCTQRLDAHGREQITTCSTTQEGEFLNYEALRYTRFVEIRQWPAMYINGQYFDRSTPVQDEICHHTRSC